MHKLKVHWIRQRIIRSVLQTAKPHYEDVRESILPR